ncbi:hypothetical protein [Microbulbifer aggregans]|nr:hypothetical protein [Microbulbifer aggregans]
MIARGATRPLQERLLERDVIMKCALISCAMLLAAGNAFPVQADAVDEPINAPGPMEYLEVTDSADPGAAQRERTLLVESIAAGLLSAGKQEQLQSLVTRQMNLLEQALRREERARAAAEAERLRLEREAAREDGQEEEREEAS